MENDRITGPKVPSATKRPKGRTLAEFGELLPAETIVLNACAQGEQATIGSEPAERPTDQNVVRSDFIRFLALGGDECAPVHQHGVHILGAWIEGDLDLRACHVDAPLDLIKCKIVGKLILLDADLIILNLANSTVNGIDGDRVRCRGNINLGHGFHATAPVRLLDARIDGSFQCAGGRFENPDGVALMCDGAKFGGIFLSRCHARGKVSMMVIKNNGNFICEEGRFENLGGDAFVCERSHIAGSVFLRNRFHATGAVRLLGTNIQGNLECDNSVFENKDGKSLDCSGTTIHGNVFLRNGFLEVKEKPKEPQCNFLLRS
jgi:hypothetical protein